MVSSPRTASRGSTPLLAGLVGLAAGCLTVCSLALRTSGGEPGSAAPAAPEAPGPEPRPSDFRVLHPTPVDARFERDPLRSPAARATESTGGEAPAADAPLEPQGSRETGLLRGRVVTRDGAGIGGAVLRVLDGHGLQRDRAAFRAVPPLAQDDDFDVAGVGRSEGVTGAFEIEVPVDLLAPVLLVRAEGYTARVFDADDLVGNDSGEPASIALEPGIELRGSVVDAGGVGIAWAQVCVRPSSSGAGGAPPTRALTDATGEFLIPDLEASTIECLVRAAGYQERWLRWDGRTGDALEIQLDVAGSVEGRVVGVLPSGLDWRDVEVRGRTEASSAAAIPESDGSFAIDGLPPSGRVCLEVRARSGVGSLLRVTGSLAHPSEATIGDRGVTLGLRSTGGLRFRAVDRSTGAPIESLRLTLEGEMQVALTGAGGAPDQAFRGGLVELDGIPAGSKLTLRASASGFAHLSRDLWIHRAAVQDLGVLEFEPQATGFLQVVDAESGEPLSRAGCQPIGADETRREPAVLTNENGQVEVPLPGHSTSVDVHRTGYVSTTIHSPSEDSGDPTHVALERSAGLRVCVVDSVGDPVSGVRVVVSNKPGVPSMSATVGRDVTDAAGRVTRLGLPSGNTRVALYEPPVRIPELRPALSRPSRVTEVTLVGGETREIQLIAGQRVSLNTWVTESGQPVEGANVHLRQLDAPGRGRLELGTTNALGELRADGVLAGSYDLFAKSPDSMTTWSQHVEALGESDQLVLMDAP